MAFTGLIVFFLACAREEKTEAEACTACGGACDGAYTATVSRTHVAGEVDYSRSPPATGDHNPCWAPWGAHDVEVAPENWVHNLEHGGLVVLWRPDADPAGVSTLRDWVSTLPVGRALATVYTGTMERPFAGVVWEHSVVMDCADTEALGALQAKWAGNAPEDLISEPPSACGDTAADSGTMTGE